MKGLLSGPETHRGSLLYQAYFQLNEPLHLSLVSHLLY